MKRISSCSSIVYLISINEYPKQKVLYLILESAKSRVSSSQVDFPLKHMLDAGFIYSIRSLNYVGQSALLVYLYSVNGAMFAYLCSV